MAPSGTVATVPTGSARSVSTPFTWAGSTWTNTGSGSCAGSTRALVASWPTSAVRTSPATWAAVSPAPMALLGSTTTWTSGVPFDRSVLRLRRSGLSARAFITSSVAAATAAVSSPLMTMLRPLEVKPAVWATATS